MSSIEHQEQIQALAESVAYAWAARESGERAFVGPCESGFTSERAVVTVAMRATLWLCVEDISRPFWAKRHAELRFTRSGRLLTPENGLWAGMKGRR